MAGLKIFTEMPSFKAVSDTKYLERLQYFWNNVTFLLSLSAEQSFLKWKFLRTRIARMAVDAITKRIVLTVSMKTCVAYGDWSRRDGIKGHLPSPVKGLAEALRKHATVMFMDEFMTSKLCSQCYQTLSTVSYTIDTKLPTRRKRKDVVLPRKRAEVQYEEKQCFGILRSALLRPRRMERQVLGPRRERRHQHGQSAQERSAKTRGHTAYS